MKKYIVILFAVLCAPSLFISCSDDDMGESIFDVSERPLNRNSSTFALDTFLIENYLNPYNLRFLYRMEDISSDMDYNLVPCKYEKGQEVAVLAKYLWFDVYKKIKNEVFLKKYSPRILHLIGSPAYNPSSGTMKLGEAEGGKKITFYRVNEIDVNNIEDLNEKFFKTMHHEFSHILHQNILYPTDFRTLSSSFYDPFKWQERSDSVVLSAGCTTAYASSEATEDWVETIANYIVKSDDAWTGMLNTASYGWEVTKVDAEAYRAMMATPGVNMDSVGYRTNKNDTKDVQGNTIEFEVVRKLISRTAEDRPILVDMTLEDGTIVKVMEYRDDDGVDGKATLEKKLAMCKEWLKSAFGIDLDLLRKEVQVRQYVTNPDGTYMKDSKGNYYNRLTYPLHEGSSETLLDSLLNDVEKFKTLPKSK